MTKVRSINLVEMVGCGVLVGAVGGLAEIIWIVFYGALSGSDIAVVARTISTTVGWMVPGGSLIAGSIGYGIAIHMIAAIGLGVALTSLWYLLAARRPAAIDEYAFLVGALTIVWLINFFVVLPLMSPVFADLHYAFREIVPYHVSLASKLLFGLAGAFALRNGASSQSARSVAVHAG
jgi:hypothetical protein